MGSNIKSNRVVVPREEYIRLLGIAVKAMYASGAEMTSKLVAQRAIRNSHAVYSKMVDLLRRGLTEQEQTIVGVPKARDLKGRIAWRDANGNRNT